jgi:hypothetical protein
MPRANPRKPLTPAEDLQRILRGLAKSSDPAVRAWARPMLKDSKKRKK